MSSRRILVCALLTACGGPADAPGSLDASGALLPDTATVDSVLVMRHSADAFERAAQYTVAAEPLVLIDAGERAEFDLTHVFAIAPLSDGRFVALRARGGGLLMQFDAAGAPQRILARTGSGPGELMRPVGPFVLRGDTVVVIEDAHKRVNRYLADVGLVAESEVHSTAMVYCYQPKGPLPGHRVVGVFGCVGGQSADTAIRLQAPVVVADFEFADIDTVVVASGAQRVPFETRYRGRRGWT